MTLLRQRNFALLWSAGLISTIGDWALFVALPIYVYRVTGSPLATSGIFVAEIVPALLLGSVAGVFVDRWDRKRTMVIANLVLTFVLLPLLAVQSARWIWIVYIVAFVQAVAVQFFTPAEGALLPAIVGQEHLVAANSLSSLSSNLARLLGPALGGATAALTGLPGVTLIDSVSFLIGAGMIALVSIPRRAAKIEEVDVADEAIASWKKVWVEWLQGVALVRRERLIAITLVVWALSGLGEGVFGVMFVVWVKNVLGGGALQLGWFMSAQAVGGLLGGLTIGYASKSLSPLRLVGVGSLVFGLLDIVLFTYPAFYRQIWLGLVVIVLVGIPAVASGAGLTTLLQSNVEDSYRGRIFGMQGTTQALLMLIGTLLAGALGAIISPIIFLDVMQGGTYIVAGVLFMTLMRQVPRRQVTPAEEQIQAS